MKNARKNLLVIALLILGGVWGAVPSRARDFLRPEEISNIRDNQDPGKRVVLYARFAQRRLDAIRKEMMSRKPNAGRTIQRMLSEYNSILDALSESLDDARKQRSSLHKGIQEMESQAHNALRDFQDLQTGSARRLGDYQFTLQEAIASTRDELAETRKGEFPEVKGRTPPTEFPARPPQNSNEEGPPRKKSRRQQ